MCKFLILAAILVGFSISPGWAADHPSVPTAKGHESMGLSLKGGTIRGSPSKSTSPLVTPAGSLGLNPAVPYPPTWRYMGEVKPGEKAVLGPESVDRSLEFLPSTYVGEQRSILSSLIRIVGLVSLLCGISYGLWRLWHKT